MTSQTFSPGATAVAEPPAPLLPTSADDEGGEGNRRKLLLVGAAVGVLVLAVAAYFLMKGGSSTPSSNGFTLPTHHVAKKPAAAAPVVHLPKPFKGHPLGRDPFKPLYTPPVPVAANPTAGQPTGSTTGTGTGSSTGTGGSTVVVPPPASGGTTSTPVASFAPVWIQLNKVNGTRSATFVVGYSNGQSRVSKTFTVLAPSSSDANGTTFARNFSLLSLQDGTATVQFGNGTPFDLAPGAVNRHQLG